MKEVRFNDKLWFGKYSGSRISELIKDDPNYIQKLIKEDKIKLDNKSKKYFEDRLGISVTKLSYQNRFDLPFPPRAEGIGNIYRIL